MEPVLTLTRLKKTYPEFVLDSIDFNLPRGCVTGLIGPNGAGKTTTIKLVMNLIRPDSGTIEIFGQRHDAREIDIKNRIGYVGEEQYFYEHRSASWTGAFVSHFFHDWDGDTYRSLLQQFGLPPKQRIKKYSKGMKVKLSLAIALSHNPELIILDEPTSGLDPVVRRDVLDLLQREAAEKEKTVLISSHITDDLERIADYVTYMIQGRIALFSSKDDLMAAWKAVHFKPDALPSNVLDSLEQTEGQMFGRTGITRRFPDIKDSLETGISRGDIRIDNVGLDDILIALVKER
jgi:ABC-2 type transport system ATP-binding protein